MQINIDEITIPEPYTRTPPKRTKINKHMLYFVEHGTFKHNITVTQRKMLVDGYCDYIIAVACGMDVVQCEINTKRLNRNLKRNRTIKNPKQKRKFLFN